MNSYLSNILNDHVKANQISAVIRFGVALIISVLLVHSHLTDLEVGILEYGILLSYSTSFFLSFAYSSGILSRIAKFTDHLRKGQLQQVFLQLILVGLFMSGFVMLGLFSLNYFGLYSIEKLYNFQIAIYCFFLIVGIIPEVYFLLYKKAKLIIYYSLIFIILLLMLIGLVLYYECTINEVFYVYIILQLAKFCLGLYLVTPSMKFDFKLQKSWFLFIIPLVIHFILGSSMDYIDGHLVAQFFDEEQFLFYRYGARELPFSLLLINAISVAMISVLSDNISEIENLKRRINRLMHFLFPISILFLFISPFLFQFVYGEQFILSSKIFNIYILIISSRLLMSHLVLYAKNDNKALMIFSGIELLLNVILSIIFMRIWGMVGIAFATVIAFGVNRLMNIIYCQRRYGIKLNQYIDIRVYGIYMLVLVGAFIVSMNFFYG